MAARGDGVRLNTDTNFLKVIAMLTMVVDHVGAVFFPSLGIMRIIGRIAFPIYAYCIAVGCIYTRSMPKYALRVLVLAVVSQPIYVIALNHVSVLMRTAVEGGYTPLSLLRWYGFSLRSANILFTLLAGILLIWSLKEQKYVVTGVLILAVWQLSPYLNYGWRGVALMLIFYAFIDRPATSFAWVLGFMLWWGLTIEFRNFEFVGVRYAVQTYAVLALPLIYLPMNTRLKLPKWVFYLFYPAHLAAIYAATVFLRG